MRTQVAGSMILLAIGLQAQAPLQTVEYWFDQSQAINSIANPNTTVPFLDLPDAVLNSNGLTSGPHTVHFRLKEDLPGSGGARYSCVVSRSFQKHANVLGSMIAVEYWFDSSNGPIYTLASSGTTIDLDDAMLNTGDLTVGSHTIHLRMKEDPPGANGIRYSSVVSRPFQKYHNGPWQITAVRYWMSQEAQPSDMHYKWFDTPQTTIDYNSWLEMCDFVLPQQSPYLKLQLRDNHGQWSVVEERPVTITDPGVLELQNIAGSSTGYCPGETYTFTANSFSGTGYATPTSFTWTVPQGNGWTAIASTGASIQVPIGTAPGQISVVSNNACGSSNSVSLAITLPVVPNITVSDAQPAQACPNTSNLTYAVTPDNSTWTYAWSGPSGWTFPGNDATMTASTGANPAPGNISITASNACGQAGNTVTIPVTITPVPAAAGNITGPDTLCEGSSGSYQVAPIANATGYLWSGSTSATTSADITAGSTDFSITVQGLNACGIAGPASPPFTVEVTPSPGVVTISGPAESCVGDEVSYVAGPLLPGATYDWTWPSGFVNMVQAGNSLTGTLGSGAATGSVVVSINTPACGLVVEVLEVSVSMVPDMQGSSIQSGDASVCVGGSGFYELVPPVPGADSLIWTWPNGTLVTEPSSATLGFESTGGQVNVVAQNSCGLSGPASLAVEVDTPPQVPVIIGDTIVCNAGSTVLSVAEVQGESYTWSDGNTTVVGDSITVIGSGNWTVAATNGGACPSATALAQVIFEQVVAESITGDSFITEPGTYVYSVVPDLSGSVSYEWHIPFFAEGSSVGGTINLFVDTAGLDTLCVVALGTYCPNDTACLSVLIDSSVDAGEAGSLMNDWRIYPVPSRGIITVDLETSNLAAIDLFAENALGERVYTMQVQRANTTWDLSHLANGPYFLRRTDRPTEVRKLLIQH